MIQLNSNPTTSGTTQIVERNVGITSSATCLAYSKANTTFIKTSPDGCNSVNAMLLVERLTVTSRKFDDKLVGIPTSNTFIIYSVALRDKYPGRLSNSRSRNASRATGCTLQVAFCQLLTNPK